MPELQPVQARTIGFIQQLDPNIEVDIQAGDENGLTPVHRGPYTTTPIWCYVNSDGGLQDLPV